MSLPAADSFRDDSDHPDIKLANAASSAEILHYVPRRQIVKSKQYRFHACKALELPDSIQSQIWRIFERNMKSIYVTSDVFPWDPPEKRKQMFHEHSRFLLTTPDSGIENLDLLNGEDVLAYSIFRFEREEERSVIYVYELQTSDSARRLGLGRVLAENLESIGRGFEMSSIMLTHLKGNDDAKTFYDSLGFEVDETSPDYEGEWIDDDDEKGSDSDDGYSILSRPINPS